MIYLLAEVSESWVFYEPAKYDVQRLLESDRETADGDKRALRGVKISSVPGRLRPATRLRTTLLFSQHTTLEEHALPELMPMTLSGEQFSPTRVSMPSTTMPRRPSSAEAAGEEA